VRLDLSIDRSVHGAHQAAKQFGEDIGRDAALVDHEAELTLGLTAERLLSEQREPVALTTGVSPRVPR